MNKGWTLWARKYWTDPEPDTFAMSVESSAPDTKRHVVVSGCATWLTVEQAEEVHSFLFSCIQLCREGPIKEFVEDEDEDEDEDYQPMQIREHWEEQRRQSRELDEHGFRV